MTLPDSSGGTTHIYLVVAGLLFSWYLLARWRKFRRSWVDVPVVGERGPIWSWKTALEYPHKTKEILQEGYDKYRDFAFQVATIRGWDVCICNETMVAELQALPDNVFSLNAFNEEYFQTEYTSPGFVDSKPTVPVPVLAKALAWARQRVSSERDPYFSGLVRELKYGLEAEMSGEGVQGNNWQQVNCFQFSSHLMLRIIARLLFGSPLCRDPEAIDLFSRYGAAVPSSGQLISWFPKLLRPWIGPRCEAPRMSRRLDAMILDTIKQRRHMDLKEPETITDYLSTWVQSGAAPELGDLNVAQMLVSVIFGSVHSAGMVLASCLYELSTRPEYVEPLRQEALNALQSGGDWTKETIESLSKLDSFIKESHRHNPLAAAALYRVAKKDYVFQNGLKIPNGTFLYTPNSPLLFDGRYYENEHEFDGTRFYKLGQKCGKPDDYKIAGQSPKSRQFGAGRHTCPGKQLAADALRLILAYILVTCDIGKKEDVTNTDGFTFTTSVGIRARAVAGK
ncbi:hypothetical protein N7449_008981 [Penicillium cf. viridicatum]|uniref:Cytochrome P450 n=1 Tax=Penicillium cf. viridicatum TaxID=2972119 RepID=A0A9W9J977_9EURO|nr:hypothetical protein N7449_008981 [Penicillium cf. viridicatum]